MTEAAVILGVILAPLLTYVTAIQHRQTKQIESMRTEQAQLRAALDAAEERERFIWGYARALVDQVYKLGGVPVEAPAYLNGLFPVRKED